MRDITWQEPPPAKRRGPQGYGEFFDALRSRPGDWALFPGSPSVSQTVQNVKRGMYSKTEPGEFEATSRSRGDGTCDIYVRYVGDGGAS